jgi:hypothetical protein
MVTNNPTAVIAMNAQEIYLEQRRRLELIDEKERQINITGEDNSAQETQRLIKVYLKPLGVIPEKQKPPHDKPKAESTTVVKAAKSVNWA